MLFTFIFEFSLAFYTLVRYRMVPLARMATFFLVLLGTFQLAEYVICVQGGGVGWARIGFVAITLMPMVGVFITSSLAPVGKLLKWGGVACAGIFVALTALYPSLITGAYCGGNYVILHQSPYLEPWYGIYYLGFIIVPMWILFRHIKKERSRFFRSGDYWLIIGILAFLIPTGIVYILSQSARDAVPSIMCGFALTFSIVLALKVVPIVAFGLRLVHKRYRHT